MQRGEGREGVKSRGRMRKEKREGRGVGGRREAERRVDSERSVGWPMVCFNQQTPVSSVPQSQCPGGRAKHLRTMLQARERGYRLG